MGLFTFRQRRPGQVLNGTAAGLGIGSARRTGGLLQRAIDLVASGRGEVAFGIRHPVPLDEAPAAFRALADGAAGSNRSVVVPTSPLPSPRRSTP